MDLSLISVGSLNVLMQPSDLFTVLLHHDTDLCSRQQMFHLVHEVQACDYCQGRPSKCTKAELLLSKVSS